MSAPAAETWKGSTFTIERTESSAPGKQVLRFSGPLTARSLYGTMSADSVRSILDAAPATDEQPATLRVFDLTGVPYIDSMGIGFVVTEYVRCKTRRIHLIAAGASPRVQELFHLTKVDTILPMAATVEEALAQ